MRYLADDCLSNQYPSPAPRPPGLAPLSTHSTSLGPTTSCMFEALVLMVLCCM